MHRFAAFVVSALIVTTGWTATGSAAPAQQAPVAPYIVLLDPDVPDVVAVAEEHADRFRGRLTFVYEHAPLGYAATLPPAAVEQIAARPEVRAVVPDRTVTTAMSNPATSPHCATAPADGQCIPRGIDRIEGERSSARAGDGEGVVDADIAVLDTGVDLTHPDLTVAGAVNCTREGSADDLRGHGTHVAGIAAARDDGIGVVGVAPGARIWAVKVLRSDGLGTDSTILCGVDWVTANASTIEVANMSLGARGGDDGSCGRTLRPPDLLHEAICASVEAGVVYTVAAGNDATDASTRRPASYDEVITVSSLTDLDGLPGALATTNECVRSGSVVRDDDFTSFSNHGPDVDVMAPGVCVWSTHTRHNPRVPGTYAVMSGTSTTSPHAAGAAALYLSRNPDATPAEVREALIASGSFDWNVSSDPDGVADPLLDVSGF